MSNLTSLKEQQSKFLKKQLALDAKEERERERKRERERESAGQSASSSLPPPSSSLPSTSSSGKVKTNILFSAVDLIRHATLPLTTLDLLLSLRLCKKQTQALLLLSALQRNPDIVWRPNRVNTRVAITQEEIDKYGREREREGGVGVGRGAGGYVEGTPPPRGVLFFAPNGLFQYRTVLGGIRTKEQLERALSENKRGISLGALLSDGFGEAGPALASLAAQGRSLLLPTLDFSRAGPRAIPPSPSLSLSLSSLSAPLCLFFFNSAAKTPASSEEVERELREAGLPLARHWTPTGEREREGVVLRVKKRRRTKRSTTLFNTHVEGLDFSRDYSAKAGLAAVVARKRREEEARAAAAMDAAIPD
jgi:hypothetical protein